MPISGIGMTPQVSDSSPPRKRRWSAWFGPGTLVAGLVFLAGRLVLEPMREFPQFDDEGMDPYGVVEKYRIREIDHPIEVAIFGSSVSIWGILPELMADELGTPHHTVRKLTVQGGTPFDMWTLLRRNPERFAKLRVAVVEINPRMLDEDTESGRMRVTVAQHATWEERSLLYRKEDRWRQRSDLFVPLHSVRRPLGDVVLNLLGPPLDSSVYPAPARRLHPQSPGWDVVDEEPESHYFVGTVSAHDAATRIMGNWQLSRLYDHALRQSIAWFTERGIPVVYHQMPVHPDVAALVSADAKVAKGYATYNRYLATLKLPREHFLQHLSCLDCGIPVHGMRDQTHLNEIGATLYSKLLAEHIRGYHKPPDMTPASR